MPLLQLDPELPEEGEAALELDLLLKGLGWHLKLLKPQ